MSSTLNLLSDSTFADKIDAQNGILTDIRDSLGGGLDTSSLVYGGTPDADSVVQLKKKDPVSGNDVNVYPALAPASSLGRYLFPVGRTEFVNTRDCFLARNYESLTIQDVCPTEDLDIGSKGFRMTSYYKFIWIKGSLINGFSSDVYKNLESIIINFIPTHNSYKPYINSVHVTTFNNEDYFVVEIEYLSYSVTSIII